MADKTPNRPANAARDDDHGGVVDNPWRSLRRYTDARIGLGRAGVSVPTAELLAFQLDHARAQDAVHQPLDVPALRQRLSAAGLCQAFHSPIELHSRAIDRITYLQRPDLGRRLDDASRQRLEALRPPAAVDRPVDLAVVIVDGLSSRAIQDNAPSVLQALSDALAADARAWQLAPLTLVHQGRVAIGDEVGEQLNARAVLVLVGERPGLSSPDSLGLYLTWGPGPGLSDADRNCISNVRPAGLTPAEACQRLMYLLAESRRRQLSGVQLKDRSDEQVIEQPQGARNFLLD